MKKEMDESLFSLEEKRRTKLVQWKIRKENETLPSKKENISTNVSLHQPMQFYERVFRRTRTTRTRPV